MRRVIPAAIVTVIVAGCGAGQHRPAHPAAVARASAQPRTADRGRTIHGKAQRRAARSRATTLAPQAGNRRPSAHPDAQALVTDERQNLLAVVNLSSASARLLVGIPGGPQYVAAEPGFALVTSPNLGTVTVLQGHPLRVVKVIHGFAAPHLVEIAPDRTHAYVTDDSRGTLTVIDLRTFRVTGVVYVGAQAHHLASSPRGRVWIALGETARTIVIVDAGNPKRPRVIGRFDPGFATHDLAFSRDGARVWVTSASGSSVAVLRARDHRLLFWVPVGPPPQHVTLSGAYAYLTSGYGSRIEQVSANTGAVLRRAAAPYGSFELAAGDGLVATASLLDGKLAIFTPQLKLRHVITIGPATRDVAISAQ